MIFQNLKLIFSRPYYAIAYFVMITLLAFLWWNYTDFELILGNYGKIHLIVDGTLSLVNIFGFPLFIVAWIFRSYTLGQKNKNSVGVGFFGGFISIIISGSICCGSSLLIPFGLSFFSTFIYKYTIWSGLEIKFLGVMILLFGLYKLLINLTTCQYTPKKSS